MYYKIENKECEVYKKLYELRISEIEMKKQNEISIQEKIGELKYRKFFGDGGQQNFSRLPQYTGFAFLNTDSVNPKIWKLHETHEGLYVPNKKTKLGREMYDFLSNGLKSSSFQKVFDVFNLDIVGNGRFVLPYLEIVENDFLILYLDDRQEPNEPNLIEITKKEFDTLLNA